MKKWDDLPDEMKTDAVRYYYEILQRKKCSLIFKRAFDILASIVMLVILSPIFLILSVAIKIESSGPVFYRQERVTRYGKRFKIHKFRTMVNGADKKGSSITTTNDNRITKVGKLIRRCRLDEISQLIDILEGNMTFVGTRPELEKYVKNYTPEMMATLLLPAGVTCMASIYYKDEAELLAGCDDIDKAYVEKILPGKMHYNLKAIEKFSFWGDIGIMIKTVLAVCGKKYESDCSELEKENETKEEICV